MNVLLLEDDQVTADYLSKALAESGHHVAHVADGLEGLNEAMSGDFDVMIVDRMVPSLDGLSVIEALRKAGRELPVLILSALDAVDERVKGLRSGGDDYMTKPFAFSELLARLEVLAVRRRQGDAPTTRLCVGDLELDLLTRQVRRGSNEIDLKPREFALLEYLMRHEGQVVTRTMLLESVWDFNFDPRTNVIDVHISRLRKKIDRDSANPLLKTVRGVGYVLRTGAS